MFLSSFEFRTFCEKFQEKSVGGENAPSGCLVLSIAHTPRKRWKCSHEEAKSAFISFQCTKTVTNRPN